MGVGRHGFRTLSEAAGCTAFTAGIQSPGPHSAPCYSAQHPSPKNGAATDEVGVPQFIHRFSQIHPEICLMVTQDSVKLTININCPRQGKDTNASRYVTGKVEHYDFSQRKRQKGTVLGRASTQWPPCHLAGQTWEQIYSEYLLLLSVVPALGPALECAGLRPVLESSPLPNIVE